MCSVDFCSMNMQHVQIKFASNFKLSEKSDSVLFQFIPSWIILPQFPTVPRSRYGVQDVNIEKWMQSNSFVRWGGEKATKPG